MKFREEKDDECALQMGPMMDCTFLLLLYFIASSQIKMVLRRIVWGFSLNELRIEVKASKVE